MNIDSYEIEIVTTITSLAKLRVKPPYITQCCLLCSIASYLNHINCLAEELRNYFAQLGFDVFVKNVSTGQCINNQPC